MTVAVEFFLKAALSRAAERYSGTRIAISRNRIAQVAATIRERQPSTELNRVRSFWFRRKIRGRSRRLFLLPPARAHKSGLVPGMGALAGGAPLQQQLARRIPNRIGSNLHCLQFRIYPHAGNDASVTLHPGTRYRPRDLD